MWRSLTEKKKRDKAAGFSKIMKILLSSIPSTGTRNACVKLSGCQDARSQEWFTATSPCPSSNHARGSAQKVGNSEPEEASRESEGEYKRGENKVHTPKKWGTSVFYSWIPYSEICKGPVNIGSLGQSSLWEKSRTQLFHLCLNSSAYMDLIILQDNLLS